MIVTEEEARTKRCQESFGPYYVTEGGGQVHTPHLQAVSIQGGAYAASMLGPALPTVASPSRCIGSACMAWRFSADETGGGIPRGYCGKAGLP